MDGLAIIDVLIGLTFTFFGLSIVASTVLEGMVSLFRIRARFLKHAVSILLGSDTQTLGSPATGTLAEKVLDHPLISSLGSKVGAGRSVLGVASGPSYVSAGTFSTALLETLRSDYRTPGGLSGIAECIIELGRDNKVTRVKGLLESHLHNAMDMADFEHAIATYFDEFMDRASGWYKRYTQVALFVVGLGLAITWDVDTRQYTKTLATNGVIRCGLVSEAATVVVDETGLAVQSSCEMNGASQPATSAQVQLDEQVKKQVCDNTATIACKRRVEKIKEDRRNSPPKNLGIDKPLQPNESIVDTISIEKYSGYILTALAVSLGSQFWLGILQMLFSMRSTGKVPERHPTKTNPTTPPGVVNAGVSSGYNFTRAQIEDLQNQFDMAERLRTGELDLTTKSLIATWQSNNGFPATGELTLQVYEMIMRPLPTAT